MTRKELDELEGQTCPIPYEVSDSETRARINWARAKVKPVVVGAESTTMHNANARGDGREVGQPDNAALPTAAVNSVSFDPTDTHDAQTPRKQGYFNDSH